MCEIRLDRGIYYQLEDRDQEAQHNVMPLKNGHKSIRCDIISIHGKAKSFEYVYFKNDNQTLLTFAIGTFPMRVNEQRSPSLCSANSYLSKTSMFGESF